MIKRIDKWVTSRGVEFGSADEAKDSELADKVSTFCVGLPYSAGLSPREIATVIIAGWVEIKKFMESPEIADLRAKDTKEKS